MRKKRFSVEQMIGVLKQAQVGVPVAEVIRKAGISEQTFYRSFASFHDPDGNGWLFQEITTRLPGRVAGDTTYTSANDLSQALRRAAAAHGQHEARTGQADPNWSDWYAEYLVSEQSGGESPQ